MRKSGIKRLVTTALLAFTVISSSMGAVLKLTDAPLSQLIELYAKESGNNIFLDESVQSQRKITVHLNGLGLEEAFKVVLKTINLETCFIGDGTIIVYPPERATRYQSGNTPIILPVPEGFSADWLGNLLKSAMPGLKTSVLPGQTNKLIILGPEEQINDARKMTLQLPEAGKAKKTIEMAPAEAQLAAKELGLVDAEVTANGLALADSSSKLWQKIESWRNGGLGSNGTENSVKLILIFCQSSPEAVSHHFSARLLGPHVGIGFGELCLTPDRACQRQFLVSPLRPLPVAILPVSS
jgi:hypothetical protein